MSVFGKLASMWVSIETRGIEAVQKAFADTQTGLSKLSAVAQAAGSQLTAALQQAALDATKVDSALAGDALRSRELIGALTGLPGASSGLAKIHAAAALISPAFLSASTSVMAFGKAIGAQTSAAVAALDKEMKAITGLGAADIWKGLGLNKNPFSMKEIKWTGTGLIQGFQGASQAAVGLSGAMGPVLSRLTSFVQAGFNASAEGQRFGLLQEQLSHQIASLFAPQLRQVVEWMQQLVDWFRSLSGEQQAQIRQWALVAGGVAAAAFVMPQVVASVQALGAAFAGLKMVMAGLSLANPWILLAAAIAAVTVAFVGMDDSMKAAGKSASFLARVPGALAEAFRRLKENDPGGLKKKASERPRDELGGRAGAFEAVADTWKRIAKTSMGVGPTSTDQIKEMLETRILEELRGIKIATQNIKLLGK